jgi:hypothetical protein
VGKKFTVRQCKKRTAKFVFAVRQCKNALQTFFWPCVFFRRASLKKRTAKHLFAVRLKNTHGKHLGARQIWSFQ